MASGYQRHGIPEPTQTYRSIIFHCRIDTFAGRNWTSKGGRMSEQKSPLWFHLTPSASRNDECQRKSATESALGRRSWSLAARGSLNHTAPSQNRPGRACFCLLNHSADQEKQPEKNPKSSLYNSPEAICRQALFKLYLQLGMGAEFGSGFEFWFH